jgi:hypothetical protein
MEQSLIAATECVVKVRLFQSAKAGFLGVLAETVGIRATAAPISAGTDLMASGVG